MDRPFQVCYSSNQSWEVPDTDFYCNNSANQDTDTYCYRDTTHRYQHTNTDSNVDGDDNTLDSNNSTYRYTDCDTDINTKLGEDIPDRR